MKIKETLSLFRRGAARISPCSGNRRTLGKGIEARNVCRYVDRMLLIAECLSELVRPHGITDNRKHDGSFPLTGMMGTIIYLEDFSCFVACQHPRCGGHDWHRKFNSQFADSDGKRIDIAAMSIDNQETRKPKCFQ